MGRVGCPCRGANTIDLNDRHRTFIDHLLAGVCRLRKCAFNRFQRGPGVIFDRAMAYLSGWNFVDVLSYTSLLVSMILKVSQGTTHPCPCAGCVLTAR